jgi:hypothetical protein
MRNSKEDKPYISEDNLPLSTDQNPCDHANHEAIKYSDYFFCLPKSMLIINYQDETVQSTEVILIPPRFLVDFIQTSEE